MNHGLRNLAVIALLSPLAACGDDTVHSEDGGTDGASEAGTAAGDDGDDGSTTAGDGGTTGAGSTTGNDDGETTSGTTGTEGSTDDGGTTSGSGTGTTGAIEPWCEILGDIELSAPSAVGLDGEWNPGEIVVVGATLTHNGTEDFNQYPGITVTSDNPLVTSENPENWLFAIFASMSAELDVQFEADASIAPGTMVTFTITMSSLNMPPCPLADSITVQATVQ